MNSSEEGQRLAFRTIVGLAIGALSVIVLTGAAVRLTEAGLGCENWPACTDERFVPELDLHPWIEFGNRLLSGIVALSVVAVVIAAYRRPRRSDLVGWSWGLVAGVAAQVVLGGITVRLDLHPAVVGLHFLLSMVLLWNAVVLWVLAGTDPSSDRAAPVLPVEIADRIGPVRLPGSGAAHGRLLVALATAVLVAGTLVTGTGPNSGDSRADRLGFDLVTIARVHGIVVWCFLAVLVTLALRLWASPPSVGAQHAFRIARLLVAVAVAQGAVGYWQFATGVPPALVAVHIAGAIVVWCSTVLLALRLRTPWSPEPPGAVATDSPQDVNVDPELDKMAT